MIHPPSGFHGIPIQSSDLWDHQDFGNREETDKDRDCGDAPLPYPSGKLLDMSFTLYVAP